MTKDFCHAQRILAVKGVGGGGSEVGLSESVNKEKFSQKYFLLIIFNEVLKIYEK